VFWLLDHPRLIAGLTSRGDNVLIQGYLSGRMEPLLSWSAENLHIFVVASLALVLAVPAGGWIRLARRLAMTSVLVTMYSLTLMVVQLKTDAERTASEKMGLTLTTHFEKVFLNWSNRGLIMVGMLALPAVVFLFMYVSSVFRTAAAEPAAGPPAEAVPRGGRKKWRMPAVAMLIAALCALAAAFPPPNPGPEETLAGLRRIVGLNPDSPQARFSLALQLEDQRKLPEAQASYEASLRLNQDQVAAWFNLGNVLIKQGEFAEAARCYGEVLQRDPAHAGARSNLGNALFNEGRYEEAAEAYQAALGIDERRPTTQKNLGETLLHLGRRCEALEHLERSVALDSRIAAAGTVGARMDRLRAECGRR
jgi:hypothetical protein